MSEPDFFDLRLRSAIEAMTGPLDDAVFRTVRRYFETRDLSGGAYLMRQGESGDTMFVLLSGRLLVQRTRRLTGVVERLGEVSPGEIAGEMALITGEPRSADLIAMRDSIVAQLHKSDFEYLVQQHPKALLSITKNIIDRFRNAGAAKRSRKKLTNLCLLPISPMKYWRSHIELLRTSLEAHGPVLILDSASVDAALDAPGISQSRRKKNFAHHQLSTWLEEQERKHRFVLYIPDAEPTEWSRRCIRQADEVLLLAYADADAHLSEMEKVLLHDRRKTILAGQTLLLLHPAGTTMPEDTKRWIAHRKLTFHHHIKAGKKTDFERVARFMNGSAIGLVLSGGGAKGFAHIGVFKALEEAGIPVDLVGGTSIGAIIGAIVARSWNARRMADECRMVFKKNPTSDFNLVPRVSIFKGKKLDQLLSENFEHEQIEDLWLNYFCVSGNLTRITPYLHRNGSLMQALRASISIPGIFPPAEMGHELFVDGGVFNNLPIDVMNQLGAGRIIAVDLQAQPLTNSTEEPGQRHRLPSLINVVMQATMVSGRYLGQEYRRNADLYFNPPLRKVALIDWSKFDQIVDIGYQHARALLAGYKEKGNDEFKNAYETKP